jgi:hypothetical protein
VWCFPVHRINSIRWTDNRQRFYSLLVTTFTCIIISVLLEQLCLISDSIPHKKVCLLLLLHSRPQDKIVFFSFLLSCFRKELYLFSFLQACFWKKFLSSSFPVLTRKKIDSHFCNRKIEGSIARWWVIILFYFLFFSFKCGWKTGRLEFWPTEFLTQTFSPPRDFKNVPAWSETSPEIRTEPKLIEGMENSHFQEIQKRILKNKFPRNSNEFPTP